MKKLSKLLSMLLAAVMLLTSAAALAEGAVPMNFIELSNIAVTKVDGSLLDLSAMKLKLGAGVSATGGEMVLTADLTAGDESAASAVLGMAEGKRFADVEGLSKPLIIDLSEENMTALYNNLTALLTEEQQAAQAQYLSAVQTLLSEDGIAQLRAAYAASFETVTSIVMSDVKTDSTSAQFMLNEGPWESAEMTRVVLTGEELDQIMQEEIRIFDSIPAVLDVLNSSLMLNGEAPVESLGALMTEEHRADVIDVLLDGGDVVIDMYENNDGSLIDICCYFVEDADALPKSMRASITSAKRMLEIGLRLDEYAGCVVALTDGDGNGTYLGFETIDSEEYAGETETIIYVQEYNDGEVETPLYGRIGPQEGYDDFGFVSLMPTSATEAVSVAWAVKGDLYVVDLVTAQSRIECGMTVIDEKSANVYMLVQNGAASGGISGTATLSTGEIAAEELTALAQADGVDVLSASEAELEAVGAELSAVMMNAMALITANIPE